MWLPSTARPAKAGQGSSSAACSLHSASTRPRARRWSTTATRGQRTARGYDSITGAVCAVLRDGGGRGRAARRSRCAADECEAVRADATVRRRRDSSLGLGLRRRQGCGEKQGRSGGGDRDGACGCAGGAGAGECGWRGACGYRRCQGCGPPHTGGAGQDQSAAVLVLHLVSANVRRACTEQGRTGQGVQVVKVCRRLPRGAGVRRKQHQRGRCATQAK
ncbi:uncharacterized protein AMSG_00974 [Thecamonas trahens ATCC 50062]|uniref:Uncharacterized protein n=1 Tax=Thecamonas trahens ATCC 50062 TaxID=461836 RepID=A0A0L0DL88_THETB|nr:hypothetical protein AMSG_00974 [Thecamonas trahens ATCC 50062]KNC52148.1 hypothetical protein AMSG_00974 [Thecamonas trahens ATCC 50062]|eukprot:XP_013762151.1 hypothetical protein AMSG_00974 [Thecamonas trahens ATCC 50062]